MQAWIETAFVVAMIGIPCACLCCFGIRLSKRFSRRNPDSPFVRALKPRDILFGSLAGIATIALLVAFQIAQRPGTSLLVASSLLVAAASIIRARRVSTHNKAQGSKRA